MKILFVKPPFPFAITAPPLGLLYLSSCLKKEFGDAVDIKLLHMWHNRAPMNAFRQLMMEWQPDIVGITALSGDGRAVQAISDAAVELNPGVHVSVGGPYPTHSPDDFDGFKNISSIIRGEGERAICDLYRAIESGNAAEVKGVSFRDSNGYLKTPDKAEVVDNLDIIPFPDWSLLGNFNEYDQRVSMNGMQAGKRVMPVFTSRGCPYRCAYCHDMFGKKVRFRSPENVVEEISILVKDYGVDEIQFTDDIFNLDRERALEICNLIVSRKLKIHISFPNGVRGDRMDRELIRALKAAGAYHISYAIETASPRLQKLLEKNVNIPKTVEAIKATADEGLIVKTFFMIGFPTETVDEIKSTVNLAVSLPLHTLVFFTVVPFSGTRLHDIATQAGSAANNELPGLHSSNYNAAEPYYTEATGFDLQRFKKRAYLRFFTPFRLIKFFLKIPRKAQYIRQLIVVLAEAFLPGRKRREDCFFE